MEVHRKLFATCGAMTFLFAVGGCGTVPTAYRGFASIEPIALPTRISPEQADEITIYAVGLVGTPYRYGGNTPESGFDCSGFSWGKFIGPIRQVMVRGLKKVDQLFVLTMAAYNLTRMGTLEKICLQTT